ncbi:Dedicator of cytokinesis family protein [Tritrichomonas foetus]|uniref:Dedicator of cytokinesis family protein n=1 Tax=Tritrichomonas foetus TaxID=1144522 RepID=A0A1J4JHD9_9EUKA|nr:Dedicator of cytokinesis family protein [Tritrichomonas foetus]|eukprot:OHS98550.1 Dedicator of cytokinesis family protein [Tritrichomonas foetus]
MSTLNEDLDIWANEKADIFKRHGMTSSKLAISKGGGLWKPPPNKEIIEKHLPDTSHPGYSFFFTPPYIITRNFAYPKPEKSSENRPNFLLFNFDDSKLPGDRPKDIQSLVSISPPLVSMFQNLEINPIMDQRADVGVLKPGPLSYYYFEYQMLSCSSPIIEPIIINLFLWDMDKKEKLSETWRFIPDAETIDQNVKSLFSDDLFKLPTKMNIPYTTIHNRIIAVVYLDRLLMRNAGSSLTKYYEKSNSSTKSAALSDIKACDQPKTMITFAWSYASLNSIIPTGDPVTYTFTNFQSAQSVSDHSLSNYFSQKQKDKALPFEVTFKLTNENSSAEKLRYFFKFPISPHNSFVNELIIQPVQAHFKLPRGIRARNVLAEFEIRANGKPLPLFNGNTTYTTHCQYHVDSPCFNDDIVIQLPCDLPLNTEFHAQFLHCSVKPKSKRVRKPCGHAVFPLFKRNGVFIQDKSHKAGISYTGTDELVPASDNNCFVFKTILRSSYYSSNATVSKVFLRKLNDLQPPPQDQVVPHLYPVLDEIIRMINEDDPNSFKALIQILAAFQRDRSHNDSQFLVFYLKFCALRHEGEGGIHQKLLPMWLKYLDEEPFVQKRPDFFCCWFLFELLVKSLLSSPENADFPSIATLTSKLSGYLPSFRESGQNIGLNLNRHLCMFYKDMFEFVPNHGIIITMSRMHLENLECDTQKNIFDRECFRDFILNFLSPKIFLFIIAPLHDGSSIFNRHYLPLIESGISHYDHTNDTFKLLFNLLLQYEPSEHKIIAKCLYPLLVSIGKWSESFDNYPSKSHIVYPLVVAHFILYNTEFDKFDQEIAFACQALLHFAQKLSKSELDKINEASKKIATPENITQAVTAGLRDPEQNQTTSPGQPAVKTRKFASLKAVSRSEMFKTKIAAISDIEKTYEALTFCTQAIMIKLALDNKNVFAFNHILATLCNVEIAPALLQCYHETLETYIDQSSNVVLDDSTSNIKHIIRKFVARLDEKKLGIITKLLEKDKEIHGIAIIIRSMVVRAFCKEPPTEEIVKLCSNSIFAEFVDELYKLNKDLSSEDLKKNNSDVYSDLLFRKAELVSISPDSRVDMLLELTGYHVETAYFSEAIISKITAAALVAEYLGRLGKIPQYFNDKSAAKMFCIACPSAISEMCSDEIVNHLPHIRGYCTSKYFTEYGLIYLIMTAMDICKRATLYELSTKIHSLLSPIAEYRHLWQVMQKHFFTGAHSWNVINIFSTSSDRSLGLYYKVQFQNGGTYIYRETNYANIWDLMGRLKKTSLYLSGGKEVEVLNEGDDLPSEGLDENKYYIHIKAVSQYFTSEERMKRITVFEQNHNIDRFYFDIPFSKTSQSSIEHCWLKRKIIKLPHPLPYIVKRVLIPPNNITEEIFSPIQFSCQNLQKQIDLIEEACARKMYKALQPLIQGALLVTVNEGPQKIAEVFLGNPDQDKKYQSALREIFRQFLKTNEKAVILHAEYVKTNPVYAMLQDELEAGLNRLNSALQPYLK